MECVVALLVCVVDVDALLRKDSHDVSMAAPGCDPERIQAVLVLLVYVNHLVFEHQSHERLTEKTKKHDGYGSLRVADDLPSFGGCDFEREALSSHEIDIVVEDSAQVHEVVRIDRFHRVADLFL